MRVKVVLEIEEFSMLDELSIAQVESEGITLRTGRRTFPAEVIDVKEVPS